MNNTTNNKKIIWTSINPGLLCAKEMVKQETPNISKEELNAIVLAFNFRYFEKVKKMLDKASIGKPIIVITKYEGINESVGDYTRVTVIDSAILVAVLIRIMTLPSGISTKTAIFARMALTVWEYEQNNTLHLTRKLR